MRSFELDARNRVDNLPGLWSRHGHCDCRRRPVTTAEAEVPGGRGVEFLRPLLVAKTAMVTREQAIAVRQKQMRVGRQNADDRGMSKPDPGPHRGDIPAQAQR